MGMYIGVLGLVQPITGLRDFCGAAILHPHGKRRHRIADYPTGFAAAL